jgi:hypothetical protein
LASSTTKKIDNIAKSPEALYSEELSTEKAESEQSKEDFLSLFEQQPEEPQSQSQEQIGKNVVKPLLLLMATKLEISWQKTFTFWLTD